MYMYMFMYVTTAAAASSEFSRYVWQTRYATAAVHHALGLDTSKYPG